MEIEKREIYEYTKDNFKVYYVSRDPKRAREWLDKTHIQVQPKKIKSDSTNIKCVKTASAITLDVDAILDSLNKTDEKLVLNKENSNEGVKINLLTPSETVTSENNLDRLILLNKSKITEKTTSPNIVSMNVVKSSTIVNCPLNNPQLPEKPKYLTVKKDIFKNPNLSEPTNICKIPTLIPISNNKLVKNQSLLKLSDKSTQYNSKEEYLTLDSFKETKSNRERFLINIIKMQNKSLQRYKEQAIKKKSLKVTPDNLALNDILQQLPESCATLFYMQFRANSTRPRGMRWSKKEKNTCLKIFQENPNCYCYLSKIMKLPTPCTLMKKN